MKDTARSLGVGKDEARHVGESIQAMLTMGSSARSGARGRTEQSLVEPSTTHDGGRMTECVSKPQTKYLSW